MVKTRTINIAPLRAMFGKIIVGQDIERELINNFTIPDTKNTIAIFFKKYAGLAYDAEALFHFLTYFSTFLYKVAPLDSKDFIRNIKVIDTESNHSGLIVNISYEIE